jgi:hypothetical protein
LADSDQQIHRSSIAHNQTHTKRVALGAVMLVIGWAVGGVASVQNQKAESKARYTHRDRSLPPGTAALFQTVGAMLIAASDVDYDQVAKRHPICVVGFALAFIIEHGLLVLMVSPISAADQTHWVSTLPFIYLLLRLRAVLQNHKEHSRFSDLFAYSLTLDLIAQGMWQITDGYVHYRPKGLPVWPSALNSIVYLSGGFFLFAFYRYRRSRMPRRLLLSITLYGYLLALGVCFLVAVHVVTSLSATSTPPSKHTDTPSFTSLSPWLTSCLLP